MVRYFGIANPDVAIVADALDFVPNQKNELVLPVSLALLCHLRIEGENL
jgi:hypothetical protein